MPSLLQRLRRKARENLRRLDPWRWRSRVVSRQEALAPGTAATIAVFNHFDPKGDVASYVLHHLDALRELGATVVLVTTSPELTAQAKAALQTRCWLVLQRRNLSLDLGGWPVAAAAVQRLTGQRPGAFKRWLFTNDSIFGPVTPLSAAWNEMTSRELDVWGLTESLERSPHLQSYFLVFERAGLAFLQDWLSRFRFLEDRDALINRYELGLSQALRSAGLRTGALISAQRLQEHLGRGDIQGNPTHRYWRECQRDLGLPYVKRDLLQGKRGLGCWAEGWREHLAVAAPDYPVRLVEDTLQHPKGQTT